jgi:aryl-alcohol dehydrogenase-like predicted oxidoreductase/enamine deaminase RidA (YjgF/YER057c/UK114 family)
MATTVTTFKLTSNLTATRVITGLWQIADMERDGKKVDRTLLVESMRAYAEQGFTTFDMADHYGSAEDISGEYIARYGKQQPVQLLTKWVPEPGRLTQEIVLRAVEKARKRLNVDAIDLLQFHAWNYADPSWLDGLFYLQELKEKGLIKNLGVTNFDTTHLRMAVKSGIEIATNQVCFSLLDQRAASQMSELCHETGVRLLAFGTLAGGFLSERWLGKAEPALNESLTWSQMKYKRFIDTAGGWARYQHLLSVLKQLAEEKSVSLANVATRYMMEQPAVAAVVIGARLGESEHLKDNLALFSLHLTERDKKMIAGAISELSKIPGDCGDEYRKPPFLTASGDLSHHVEKFPPPYSVIETPERKKVLSGTVWEDLAGYSRAVRKGPHITISGTTATHGSRVIGGNDPTAQTHFIIDKIEGALQSLESKLEHVVRTRIFVRNINDWEAVARAHGERFKSIQPANTLVSADLVGEEYLVEIEADAIVE